MSGTTIKTIILQHDNYTIERRQIISANHTLYLPLDSEILSVGVETISRPEFEAIQAIYAYIKVYDEETRKEKWDELDKEFNSIFQICVLHVSEALDIYNEGWQFLGWADLASGVGGMVIGRDLGRKRKTASFQASVPARNPVSYSIETVSGTLDSGNWDTVQVDKPAESDETTEV